MTVTQPLLGSCIVSCKSLHLSVLPSKSFNWCLALLLTAEDLQARGTMLAHQQATLSEEARAQGEAN